jgi:hypothetical protein
MTGLWTLTVEQLWTRIAWLTPEEATAVYERSTWQASQRDLARDGAWDIATDIGRSNTSEAEDIARVAGRASIGSLTPDGHRTWQSTWHRTWGPLWHRTWAESGLSPDDRPQMAPGPWSGGFLEARLPICRWENAWENAWDVAWGGAWGMSWCALALAGTEHPDRSGQAIDVLAVTCPVREVLYGEGMSSR